MHRGEYGGPGDRDGPVQVLVVPQWRIVVGVEVLDQVPVPAPGVLVVALTDQQYLHGVRGLLGGTGAVAPRAVRVLGRAYPLPGPVDRVPGGRAAEAVQGEQATGGGVVRGGGPPVVPAADGPLLAAQPRNDFHGRGAVPVPVG